MYQHDYNVSATFVPGGMEEYYDYNAPESPALAAPAPQRSVEPTCTNTCVPNLLQSYARDAASNPRGYSQHGHQLFQWTYSSEHCITKD